MSLDISLTLNEESLPLPMYLASTNRFALLRHLIDDGTINFATYDTQANDMWACISVTGANIPHMCAVMEHFGADLQGSTVDLALWITANPLLVRTLTDALSLVPCPYPHLARAVVEVTPIDSQAVTIAAKQGFVDWIDREAASLADTRPEGYSNWRSLCNRLHSQGGLSTNARVAVATIAILSEQAFARKEPAVALARAKAVVEVQFTDVSSDPKDMASTCASFEKLGGLQSRADELDKWVKSLSDASRTALVAELCTDEYSTTARAVVEVCINMDDAGRSKYCEFVRVIGHYGFADLIRDFVHKSNLASNQDDGSERDDDGSDDSDDSEDDDDGSDDYDDSEDDDDKSFVLEADGDISDEDYESDEEDGDNDDVDNEYDNDSEEEAEEEEDAEEKKKYENVIVPKFVPSSPHRLSEDDTVNAWLWLIKGDGDIDDKVWEVIKKSRLLKMRENDVDYYDVDAYIDLVVGAYRSGAKVTAKELIHTMNYKENADYLLLHEASYGSDLEALKCLVEAGADVYAVDSDGNTCLHMTDNDDIIKYIVEECYRRTLS
jgi:hypothetical protein